MPSQTAAASSKDRLSGIAAIGACSGRHRYSACAPMPVGVDAEHAVAGREPLTSAPTSATTPANSVPSTGCFGRSQPVKNRAIHGVALRSPQSVRFTVVEWTRTRTSPGPGTGRGISREVQHLGGTEPGVDDGSHGHRGSWVRLGRLIGPPWLRGMVLVTAT